MPAARAIHVLVAACDALAEAHAAGLVHRDVKPGNIMVTQRGLTFDVVKVMDFGLVKDTGGQDVALTGVGEICGTPETIAPESIRGKAVGPAADLYALGAVGCWLLTGKHVFDATTALEYVAAHLHTEPIRPSGRGVAVPADLEDALMRCLAKDPAERPASAVELRDTLLACADAGRWSQADAKAWWAARRPEGPRE
jgi:serine/threonine-protein kinase